MTHAENIASVTDSNPAIAYVKACFVTLAILLTNGCQPYLQESASRATSNETTKPKPDLLSAIGDIALCPEPNAEALGIIAFPKASGSIPIRCNSQTSAAFGLGVFRHDRGCSSPQKILVAYQLASLFGNEHLFARAAPMSLSRQTAAAVTAKAAQTAPRTFAPKWLLLTTYLRSQTISSSVRDLQNPVSQESIQGVFVHTQERSEAFGETKNIDSSSKAARRSGEWAAFATPTWQNLASRSSRRNDSPQFNVTAAVQQAELMGDLADIVIIGAIRGGINNDARVETIKFDYNRGPEGISSKRVTIDGAGTGSILQRLQVRDGACQQSDPREFMVRVRELHHVRYSTYQRITELSENATDDARRLSPVSGQLDLTPEMQSNLQEVATILYRKCIGNRLHFDLEPNDQVPASAEKPATQLPCKIQDQKSPVL